MKTKFFLLVAVTLAAISFASCKSNKRETMTVIPAASAHPTPQASPSIY